MGAAIGAITLIPVRTGRGFVGVVGAAVATGGIEYRFVFTSKGSASHLVSIAISLGRVFVCGGDEVGVDCGASHG